MRRPIHQIYLSKVQVYCEAFVALSGKSPMADQAIVELDSLAVSFSETELTSGQVEESRLQLKKFRETYKRSPVLTSKIETLLYVLTQDL